MRETFRKNPWAVALGLAILAIVSWNALADLEPPGPPAEPGTMQNVIYAADLPLTITAPGTYHLGENIVTAGGGITVSTSNVTIDLMGFTLEGGTGDGIFAGAGTSNIAVKNGTVRNWGGGGVTLSSNSQVVQVRADGNLGTGITVESGSLVRDCTAFGNGGGIAASGGSTVVDCVARLNTSYGIAVGGYCTVANSTVTGNDGFGISATFGGTITNCTAGDNNDDGISAFQGSVLSNCTAYSNGNAAGEDGIVCTFGCTITGCAATTNFEDGIEVTHNNRVFGNVCSQNSSNGIHVLGNDNRIEENNVVDNTVGIDVNPATGNFIIRNSASNFGTNYDFAAGNSYGAITAGAAGFSDTNSYANYTY